MKKLKRFLIYYKPHKKVLAIDLFCAVISSLVTLVFPLLIGFIMTIVENRTIDMNTVMWLGVAFIGLMIVEYVCQYYMTYIGHVMGAKMEFDMRKDIFGHLQKLSFSFFDNQKTGQLMSRITNDLFEITELAHHGPEDILISIVRLIGAVIILSFVNVPLMLILVAMIPFMFLFAKFCNKRMRTAFRANRLRIAEINAQIEDSISGVRVVKGFANEDLENKKFQEGNMNFVKSRAMAFKTMASYHGGLRFIMSFMNITIIIVGAWFITRDVIGVSALVMFILYINTLMDPIRRLIQFTEQFQNGATGFERFLEILDIEPDIKDRKDAIELKDVKGKIEFKNVTFNYKDVEQNVFENVNLNIDAGDYVALVGPSGVGKTTLCSLIPRFYEPSSGEILVDGVNVNRFKLKSLRQHIGIVQQDVYLFTGSVRENIAYGKKDATDDEIIAAAKSANAHDFIMELPDGYDSYIGQRGVKLSGGQKQRLSIARVFLKNPPILIFDEATSSLDNESEQVVQQSLETLAKNRTTLCIAHRLSTIKNAKIILVLTENGISERGTHEELIALGGTYAKYYELTLHGQELLT
ncbi:MAG: ABC transporter ATP-binding protein/permease [Defluviitaleaceae bacterium]|nr:ABC transporter ATP-binding protein/permease [Defluviitaleaceae bacterium]